MAKKLLAVALPLALVLCAGAPAFSQGGPKGGERNQGNLPIEITADRVSADSVRNVMTFEGNVVARQGDVTMHSNLLRAEYSREAETVERIVAEGNVRFVQGDREARGPKATFYNSEQRVVLSGGATLREGENTLQGETVTIFLQENRSMATGGGEDGRVKAVIMPKSAPGKSAK